MTNGKEKQPVGYGHDAKGAAGGDTNVEGRPNVAHTGPADQVQGKGEGPKTITFTLDGEEVHARDGETIWQVAKHQGTDIPHLCYAPEPGYRPDGNATSNFSSCISASGKGARPSLVGKLPTRTGW